MTGSNVAGNYHWNLPNGSRGCPGSVSVVLKSGRKIHDGHVRQKN